MSQAGEYLLKNLTVTLFICLSLGYYLGKVKIRSFTVGATAGSLIVGLLVGVFIQQFAFADAGSHTIVSGPIKDIFFALFCFTIGFEVGPGFFGSLKATGLKIIILSVIFAAAGLGSVYVLSKVFHLDAGYGAGLIAGALTQSAVLGVVDEALSANASVAYAITYVFGTIGVILFIKKIGPAMLRKDLFVITKEKIDSLSASQKSVKEDGSSSMIQVRAYEVTSASEYCGLSVEEMEEKNEFPLEIEAVYRNGEYLTGSSGFTLQPGDVIQVVGSIKALDTADNRGLNEVSDSRYFQIKLINCEIVLTQDFTPEVDQLLSDHGILLKNHGQKQSLKKHSIIAVTGSAKAIAHVAKQIGYIKEDGDSTDIPLMTLLVAAGLIIGAIGISSFSLGSAAVLLIGMLTGWFYNSRPKHGYIPSSARWILKNIGLNMFIVVTALNVSGSFMHSLSGLGTKVFVLLLAGALTTLIPYAVSLLFGKHVLKINDADLLGGLCGCGTCSAGLNALTEETNSSVFAIGYAPGCAAGNILLVVIAIIFVGIY